MGLARRGTQRGPRRLRTPGAKKKKKKQTTTQDEEKTVRE
jgi:hypothetical protein